MKNIIISAIFSFVSLACQTEDIYNAENLVNEENNSSETPGIPESTDPTDQSYEELLANINQFDWEYYASRNLTSCNAANNPKENCPFYPITWNNLYLQSGKSFHAFIFFNNYPQINNSVVTIKGESIKPGDYVGAFLEDENNEILIVGAGQWTGGNFFLKVMPDNTDTPNKDGYLYGEKIKWCIFSQKDQKTYLVEDGDVTYQIPQLSGHQGTLNFRGGLTLSDLENFEAKNGIELDL